MRAAAVILAAGASRRMGTPKALLQYRGQSFASRLVSLFEPYCNPVVVVLGHHAAEIRRVLSPGPLLVENPEPDNGQLSSLQCGLRAAGPGSDAVFFTPVDLPAVEPSTVASLLAGFRDGADAAVPRYRGRHGHPVLIGARLVPFFLNLPTSASARDVMHAHASATAYVDVEDSGVVRDIDDPAAYAELLEANR